MIYSVSCLLCVLLCLIFVYSILARGLVESGDIAKYNSPNRLEMPVLVVYVFLNC